MQFMPSAAAEALPHAQPGVRRYARRRRSVRHSTILGKHGHSFRLPNMTKSALLKLRFYSVTSTQLPTFQQSTLSSVGFDWREFRTKDLKAVQK